MNFSNLSIAPIEEVLSVKDICYGLAGANLLILIIFLFAINFFAFYYWKKLREIKVNLLGKKIELLYFIPVINGCLLIFVFVLAYNIF